MSTFEKCDRCGAVSPNADGLFVSNKWTECFPPHLRDVFVIRTADPVLLCEDCWKRAMEDK